MAYLISNNKIYSFVKAKMLQKLKIDVFVLVDSSRQAKTKIEFRVHILDINNLQFICI